MTVVLIVIYVVIAALTMRMVAFHEHPATSISRLEIAIKAFITGILWPVFLIIFVCIGMWGTVVDPFLGF